MVGGRKAETALIMTSALSESGKAHVSPSLRVSGPRSVGARPFSGRSVEGGAHSSGDKRWYVQPGLLEASGEEKSWRRETRE